MTTGNSHVHPYFQNILNGLNPQAISFRAILTTKLKQEQLVSLSSDYGYYYDVRGDYVLFFRSKDCIGVVEIKSRKIIPMKSFVQELHELINNEQELSFIKSYCGESNG